MRCSFRSIPALVLGAAVALLAACSDNNGKKDGGIDAAGPSLSNGQVAQVLLSVNTAELTQAQLALAQATLNDVRVYAQRMQDDHNAAQQRQQQLFQQLTITPADSNINQMLVQQANNNTARLRAAGQDGGLPQDGGVVNDGGVNNPLFDRTYIDIQAGQHDQVLTLIDSALLPAVQTGPLRNELTATRQTVQDHRDQARTIRDRIGAP